jgi:hypothetical protein
MDGALTIFSQVSAEAVLFRPSYPTELYLNVQGTLDQWRQNIGLNV